MDDGHAPFAGMLRTLRRRRGLSQVELARRSGVAERTISDLERGVWKTPRTDTAVLLADALALDPAQRDAWFTLVDLERDAREETARRLEGPLPPEPSPLCGRAAEVAALLERLETPGARVTTLVGPGGIGKTRLALAALHRLRERGGTVAWTPLESLGAPEEVLPAVARSLGAAGQAGDGPLARIVAALDGRAVTLAVDNAEHVLDAAADLAALVAAAPGLALLVTSREALRIAGERTVAVGPLAVDDVPGDLAPGPAVELFLARIAAGEAAPLPEARRIARAVDGVPLAIELAAAQRDTMSVAAIADLLERDSLAALASGRRDGPARFRTMERAVRWSQDLLDPAARRLLRALSVFRGGADLDLLAEACDRLGCPGLLGEAPALVRASLVQERDRRFAMLAPIRMFAEAELARAGERDAAEAAHLDVFAAVARDACRRISGPDAAAALDLLDRERDNLFAALDRAIRAGDGRRALAIAADLGYWAELRGEFQSMTRWLERAIAVDDGSGPASDRWRARWFAAQFCNHQAWADRAEAFGQDAIAVARAAGDREGAGAGAIVLGDVAWMRRDDHAGAMDRYRDAIAALEPLGPSVWLAHAHAGRGLAEVAVGDRSASVGDLERSLRVWERLGNALFVAMPNCHLGEALRVLRRDAEAREAYQRALEASARFDQPMALAVALPGIAALDAASPDAGRREDAARLLGASDGLFARIGLSHDLSVDQVVTEARAALLAAMPEPDLERLVAEGRAMPVADALALALGG